MTKWIQGLSLHEGLAYLLVAFLALFFIYAVARVISRANVKSKLEYMNEMKRRKEHDHATKTKQTGSTTE